MSSGTRHITTLALAVIIDLAVFSPQRAHADVTFRTVALTGDQTPGSAEGMIFTALDKPVINNAGQVAFISSATGPAGIIESVWRNSLNDYTVIAQTDIAAPNTEPGTVFNGFFDVTLNDPGQVAFGANLSGPAVGILNSAGIWSDRSGPLHKIVRHGDPATDAAPGVVYRFVSPPTLNANGAGPFMTRLTGVGINSQNQDGILADVSGDLQLVARDGSPAPDTESGTVFSLTFSPSILAANDGGKTAFVAGLSGPPVTNLNNQGIWITDGGPPSLLVREGDAAPGTTGGAVFSGYATNTFGTPTINAAGQVLVSGLINGPGTDSTNNSGLWMFGPDVSRLVARSGDAAENTNGLDLLTAINSHYSLNEHGITAFSGGVNGDAGIWLEDDGALNLIFREGDAAPGTGGLSFRNFGSVQINAINQLAFTGTVIGPGVTFDSDEALWATTPDGATSLIAREGDLFDVDQHSSVDDFRIVDTIDLNISRGGDSGAPRSFNDAGQLAFRLTFTDGTEGIFVATLGIPGDLDGDGFVGIADLNLILANWNQTAPPADALADTNGDNFVGIADLNAVLGNWNAGTPPETSASIPEPATLLLCAALLPSLTRRPQKPLAA